MTGVGAIPVMFVEDEPAFRELITAVLGRDGRYRLHAAEVGRWLEDVRETCPDILLLDLTLDGVDAVPWIPKVVASCPSTMVAALTARPADGRQPVLTAGAFVFYEKTALPHLPDRLERDLDLFRRALEGHDVLAPSALRTRSAVPNCRAPKTTVEDRHVG